MHLRVYRIVFLMRPLPLKYGEPARLHISIGLGRAVTGAGLRASRDGY